MKIQATTRPLLVQFQLKGKHYGVDHSDNGNRGVEPFEESRLKVGEEVTLTEGDRLVAVRFLSE